jgi:NADH dehydrogenase
MPGLAAEEIRWMLLDTAPRLLSQLDERLSKTADRVPRRRGVEVLTGASVTEALDGYVQLSTGDKVPTRSLIWRVGVRADSLVDGLDLGTAGDGWTSTRTWKGPVPRAFTPAGTAPRWPT